MKWHYCLLALITITFFACKKSKDKKTLAPLEQGLQAYFKFDNKFEDSTGNVGPILSTASGITFVKDRNAKDNSAVHFDGGVMSVAVKNFTGSPISISLWERFSIGAPNVTYYFLSASSATFGMLQENQGMGFAISLPSTASAYAQVENGWQHVVGTYDGKDIKLYINGVLKKTLNHPGEPETTSAFKIGSLNSNKIWVGILDDIRIYNRVLTNEEILQLSKM